jgi:hypothetical protein
MPILATKALDGGVVGRKFKGTLQTSGNEHSVGRIFVMIRKENTETRKVPRLEWHKSNWTFLWIGDLKNAPPEICIDIVLLSTFSCERTLLSRFEDASRIWA